MSKGYTQTLNWPIQCIYIYYIYMRETLLYIYICIYIQAFGHHSTYTATQEKYRHKHTPRQRDRETERGDLHVCKHEGTPEHYSVWAPHVQSPGHQCIYVSSRVTRIARAIMLR